MRQPSQWGIAAVCAAGIASSMVLLYSWHYTQRKKHRTGDKVTRKETEEFQIKTHLPSHLNRELHKEQRRQEKLPDLARKTPMYDNINMLDPQGEMLATISRKKARWYVKKNLAHWSHPDSSIQLNFSPKAHSGDEYSMTPKSNVCVGCGSDGMHMRHYVVPYAYRSLLPIEYKTHLSHDIIILCPDCHLHCEYETQLRMKELEEDCPDKCRNPHYVNVHLHQVRSAALALLRWSDKIPAQKLQEYDRLVRNHLNVSSGEELSPEKLQEAINVEYRIASPDYIAGPEWVIRSLGSSSVKIERFVKQWRQHFVATVQPKFLPHGWSVDAPVTSNVQATANVDR
jgi:hypothetical protein